MARIAIPAADHTPDASRPVVDAITKQLGMTPNLFLIMAQSPQALNGWAALQGALQKTLDAKLRDAIALAVSQVNECQYCLSAHTYVASNFAHIDADEIRRNRLGQSGNPRTAAAVAFAKALMQTRGKVSEADLDKVRAAGFSDANIVEIIALSAQFMLTNFINNAFDTDIDFPVVNPDLPEPELT
ncbi:carboxymuconolactone decarboxylase family protein [Paraburkholderia sp.]|uniref:carboxymuconolactone decarboxylase family protein n=1 Tax=Paraburkholderia sp. TaxID=1926495 RepID=UPI0039E469A1